MVINIYVDGGNPQDPSYYRFYSDPAGIISFETTLNRANSYKFQRLNSTITSHPFYISDQGTNANRQAPSTAISITGSGDHTAGITEDKSFTLIFNSGSNSISNLHYFCTVELHNMFKSEGFTLTGTAPVVSANFRGAIFDSSTQWTNDVVPDGAVEAGVQPNGLNFQGANLTEASFNGMEIGSAFFDGATFSNTQFNNVELKNVDFGDIDISELKFDSNTTFEDVTFENPNGGDDVVITAGDSTEVLKKFYQELNIILSGDTWDSQIASALGDPYIYPMRSSTPVKLPDLEACYRLYQCDNTFINAEVSIATKEHENRMTEFVEKLGHDTKNVITDGYFFSKFFIADGKNKMVVDLRKKNLYHLGGSDKTFFNISQNNNNAGNKDWNGKARNVVVQWITEEGNIMKATISFFTNPHIENGISLSVSSLPKKALGLCVSNYRPKLMRVPSVVTEKHGKIARQVKKSRNPFQKIAIKSNREGWVAKN